MFVTAQRVVGASGESAISVIQYTHEGALAELPTTQEDFRRWTEQQPGRVVVSSLAQIQGDVLASFLDIVATDGTPLPTVLEHLHRACLALPNLGNDDYWSSGPLALRFSVHPQLEATKWVELRMLKDAFGVLAPRVGVVMRPSQPIKIIVTPDPVGVAFHLAPDSADFLRSVGVMIPGLVHIQHDVRAALESQWFDAYPQYASAATGLRPEQLETLGQVVFLDAISGEPIWASPA
jgi:hypothetical protein